MNCCFCLTGIKFCAVNPSAIGFISLLSVFVTVNKLDWPNSPKGKLDVSIRKREHVLFEEKNKFYACQ